jgi:RNA polymerase sigma-70 factor (ECF subfamily)
MMPAGAIDREDSEAAALMRRLKRGDVEALGELYRRYASRVHLYVLSSLGDADADDVTQEVFLRVLRSASTFDSHGRDSSFRAWLFRIAHNRVITHHGRQRRMQVMDPDAAIYLHDLDQLRRQLPSSDQPARAAEAAWRVLGDLPQPQREVLALRFLWDLSSSEIAKIRGASPAGVRQLQRRALRNLARKGSALGVESASHHGMCMRTEERRLPRRPACDIAYA